MTGREVCSKMLVMPGLVPGIHVFTSLRVFEDVDGRDI
jgi:hypothetical protein